MASGPSHRRLGATGDSSVRVSFLGVALSLRNRVGIFIRSTKYGRDTPLCFDCGFRERQLPHQAPVDDLRVSACPFTDDDVESLTETIPVGASVIIFAN